MHSNTGNDIDKQLVSVGELDTDLLLDIRYFSTNNFLGVRVRGYQSPRCYLTRPTAEALMAVQKAVKAQGYTLKIFDGYRPQQAVDHFVAWAKDVDDTKMKSQYYPNVDKRDLFKAGYIAAQSSHTLGNTVDLTLVERATQKELDMGTPFDYFDPLSHTMNPTISQVARKNRALLKDFMEQQGFQNLATEWWHYTLASVHDLAK